MQKHSRLRNVLAGLVILGLLIVIANLVRNAHLEKSAVRVDPVAELREIVKDHFPVMLVDASPIDVTRTDSLVYPLRGTVQYDLEPLHFHYETTFGYDGSRWVALSARHREHQTSYDPSTPWADWIDDGHDIYEWHKLEVRGWNEMLRLFYERRPK